VTITSIAYSSKRRHQRESDPPSDKAKGSSAQSLLGKEPRCLREHGNTARWGRAALLREPEQHREQHDADTVVEQGLAFHFDAQQLGDAHPFHDRNYRDRVGRRNQRAKDRRPDQRQLKAKQVRAPPQGAANNHRREQCADNSHSKDCRTTLCNDGKINMNRSGEEQRRKKPVQQYTLEVYWFEYRARPLANTQFRKGELDDDDGERCHQRDCH
jgi:hypothetical protein